MLWGEPGLFASLSPAWQSNLCRAYLILSFGVAEPLFIMLALLVTRRAVALSPAVSQRSAARLIYMAALYSLPVCVAQCAIALYDLGDNPIEGPINNSLPDVFVHSFAYGPCSGSAARDECVEAAAAASAPPPDGSCPPGGAECCCAFCTVPLFSTIASAVLVILWLAGLTYVSMQLAALVVNRALLKRLRMLQGVLSVSLLVALCTRLGRAFTTAGSAGSTTLGLVYAACAAAAAAGGVITLALRPVMDATALIGVLRREDAEQRLLSGAGFVGVTPVAAPGWLALGDGPLGDGPSGDGDRGEGSTAEGAPQVPDAAPASQQTLELAETGSQPNPLLEAHAMPSEMSAASLSPAAVATPGRRGGGDDAAARLSLEFDGLGNERSPEHRPATEEHDAGHLLQETEEAS